MATKGTGQAFSRGRVSQLSIQLRIFHMPASPTAPLMPSCAGGERAAASAVKCFQAWLGLDASGGGSALVSPGELYAGHRQLFDALLAAVGSDSDALLEDLAETLGMFFGAFVSSAAGCACTSCFPG